MFNKKTKFTLIELIVVIAVLGILATIVIPNVSNQNEKGYIAHVQSNIKNIETAVTMYHMENESYPTLKQPTLGKPSLIDFELLNEKYLKNQPKYTEDYWVDYTGKVYGSNSNIPQIKGAGKIAWKKDSIDIGYKVYEVQESGEQKLVKEINNQHKSNKKYKRKISLVAENMVSEDVSVVEYVGEDNATYLVSAIDKYGFDTPPANEIGDGKLELKPNEMTRTFYIDTYADHVADWISFYKRDYVPKGASVDYEFSASNDDGKTFTEYVDNISLVPDSKMVRIKITLTKTEEKSPYVEYVELGFYVGEKDKTINTCSIPLGSNKVNCNSSTSNGGSPSSSGGSPSGGGNVIIDIPNGGSLSGSVDLGGNYSPEDICYRNSEDKINWSECVSFPEQLPPTTGGGNGPHIEIVTPPGSTNQYQPEIVVTPNIKPPASIDSEKGWVIYDKFTYVASPNVPVKWLEVDIIQTKPNTDDSKIEVKYAYSRGGILTEDFTSGAKSKILKISTKSKAKESVDPNEYPYLEKIVVKYEKLDGTGEIVEEEIIVNDSSPKFEGEDYKMFDDDLDTFYTSNESIYVDLIGDFTNKKISVKTLREKSGIIYPTTVYFLNKLGEKVDFKTSEGEIQNKLAVNTKELQDLIVPAGACQLVFENLASATLYVHEVLEPISSDIVHNIENLMGISDSYGREISLTWEDNSNENIREYWIYRDNEFVGKTTEKTFIDNQIHPNTIYQYNVIAVSNTGNISNHSDILSIKTSQPSAYFEGGDPKMFDDDLDTFYTSNESIYVDLIGDFTNKKISVKTLRKKSGIIYPTTVYFLNELGEKVDFKTSEGEIQNKLEVNTKELQDLIVPAGACQLVFENLASATLYIDEVFEPINSDIVHNIENLMGISDSHGREISLTWEDNSNENIREYWIYRDNEFVGKTTEKTFTDNQVHPNTIYQYNVIAVSNTGNISNHSDILSIKTSQPSAYFEGGDPKMFDDDLDTFYTSKESIYLNLIGNFTNKEISVKTFRKKSGTIYPTTVYFLNELGEKVDFKVSPEGETMAQVSAAKGELQKLIVPEGAYQLVFENSAGAILYIHEVLEPIE